MTGNMLLQVQFVTCDAHQLAELLVAFPYGGSAVIRAIYESALVYRQNRYGNQPESSVVHKAHQGNMKAVHKAIESHERFEFVPCRLRSKLVSSTK